MSSTADSVSPHHISPSTALTANRRLLSDSPPTSPSSNHVPLSAQKQNTLPMPSTTLKRKLTDRDDMPTAAATKKHRPSVPSVIITLKPTKQKPFASAPIPMPNACPDYPNGFIYCHQCSKKRDVTDAIQCTFLETQQSTAKDKDKDNDEKKENDEGKDKDKEKDKEKPPRQRRCVGKFCKFCLKNRYDHDFDDVVNVARAKKKEPGHIDTAGYIYKCPKCSETCNCPRCRKSKGLEPMGSAGTIRKPPPEPVPKPSAAEKKKIKAAADRKSKSSKNGNGSSSSSGKGAKKPKPKPLPIAKWTPVPVNLSLDDAEARFHIREFVLRFADLMEPTLPKTNLEELEEIGGGRHQGRDESEEMVSWVSEFCVKSIIVALLNLIAKELHGTLAATIKSAVKEIRNLGVNLNKIWPVLASLRDDVSFLADGGDNNANNDDTNSAPQQQQQQNTSPSTLPGSSSQRRPFIFTFPDPLPPPTTYDIRNIRSTRLHDTNDGLHIAYSAQMVPVITALIEDALLTAAVREEIEAGVREGREAVRDQREAVKREAERWEQVRKTMETRVKLKAQILENRAKREYHKQKLISLENSLKILFPKFSPRLAPVGFDMEDRVYWIISPGVSESEAAQDFIHSCASDEKLLLQANNHKKSHHRRSIVKRAKVLGSEERMEMRSWSWFVAVWGKKPVDVVGSSNPVKESQKREEVKLKIKVNGGGVIKAKRRNESEDEEDMDVDKMEPQDRHDEDEEMASASDQEDRDRDSDSSTSSSSSQSDSDDGEGSDDDAKPAPDETGSSSDEEEQSEEEQEEEEEEDKEGEEEEDNDRERWWGFYDPLEILKLSDWITIKAGLDESDDPTSTAPLPSHPDEHSSRASSSTVTPNGTATPTVNGSANGYTNGITNAGQKSRDTSVTLVANHSSSSLSRPRPPLSGGKVQLKSLVDELKTFATLLEWRCREDKYELILRDLAAAAGGSSSVSVSVNGSVNGDGGVVTKGQRERESTDGRSISVSSFNGAR